MLARAAQHLLEPAAGAVAGRRLCAELGAQLEKCGLVGRPESREAKGDKLRARRQQRDACALRAAAWQVEHGCSDAEDHLAAKVHRHRNRRVPTGAQRGRAASCGR